MTRYYDTGVLLKLYTPESDSAAVADFVRRTRQPLPFTHLHRAECTAALRLKVFRGECTEAAVSGALRDLDEDAVRGVLRGVEIDWNEAWGRCASLSDAHAASTGCRTLDSLHVACATVLGIRTLVTTDPRQGRLALKAGMKTVNPVAA